MPINWTQHYTPVLNSLLLSAIVAALPLCALLGSLAIFRVKAHLAALLGLASALTIAVFVYGMPTALACAAAIYGAAYGLFPIGWIVLCAIFVYDITVKTGTFDVVKESIAHLADDRRIQTLLIAFSFGAFIEGAAGFGTPVAISGAMLIGLGFKPLQAAGLALIGNTAPVAYGGLGTPIIALAAVTGLPLKDLGAAVGRQLPLFSLLVPFWIVAAMAGMKAMREVWPACLVAGLTFSCTQFLVSNFHGPWIVDIASSLVSMISLVTLLKFWKPPTVWRFEGDPEPVMGRGRRYSSRKVLLAWMPWFLLSVFVFLWGLPEIKDMLNNAVPLAAGKYQVPLLDNSVLRNIPVVHQPRPESAVFVFDWLSATGTSLLLAGLLSGFLLRMKPYEIVGVFLGTLRRVGKSLLTIAAMLALGFCIRYAGLDATIGLAFAGTGVLFPFFSPILGWLGVALTGSDTSSNVLFGGLQQITAQALGISPILAAAANSSGGVMGKMINAQSIVVASVATGQQGQEGTILRYVFWHSIVLACLVGVVILVQAYLLPSLIS